MLIFMQAKQIKEETKSSRNLVFTDDNKRLFTSNLSKMTASRSQERNR